MRSIAAALFGITLAAGAGYAHGNHADGLDQAAGTLTCVTKPELSLVFGRSPVADCTFVSARGDVRQDYQALLSTTGAAGDVETQQRIVWRVLTRDGVSRPEILNGRFAPALDATDAAGPELTLSGPLASLRLVSHSGRSVRAFGLSQPRIDLATVGATAQR